MGPSGSLQSEGWVARLVAWCLPLLGVMACSGVVWPEDQVADLLSHPNPGQSTPPMCGCDRDQDGYSSTSWPGCSPLPPDCPAAGDCNDADAHTHPGAREDTRATCSDGLDNNCNGTIDGSQETVIMKHFIPMLALVGTISSMGGVAELDGCNDPVTDMDGDGYSVEDGDCDDANPTIYPGAPDGLDASGAPVSCDGIDNDCDGEVDEDCGALTDSDGDGVPDDRDCAPRDATIYPGAPDGTDASGSTLSCDGIDNDCDGEIDEGCDPATDSDGDGVPDDRDCAPRDPSIYPGAPERCDQVDNDCDGEVDEGCNPTADADGDGFPAGQECNDQDASIYPGAPERCDRKDNDCDGQVDEGCGTTTDADADGYPAGQDCNDQDASIYPGARELCDRKDNDCDGQIDENCTPTTDADADGYPAGQDCNDQDPTIYPGAREVCDRKDNDCDGQVDEGC